MSIKKIFRFLPGRQRTKSSNILSSKTSNSKSDIEITVNSDFESVKVYLNEIGIHFKGKTLKELNLLIDNKIEEKFKEYRLLNYPNIRTTLVAQVFCNELEYKNLINLKGHMVELHDWLNKDLPIFN